MSSKILNPAPVKWACILAFGLFTSEAALAATSSGLITLANVGNSATTASASVDQTTCPGSTLAQVDITYTSKMTSDYTFRNTSGANANVTGILTHPQLDLKVGTLPAYHPDLNSYSQSWTADEDNPAEDNPVLPMQTHTNVVPPVPSPTVVSETPAGGTIMSYTEPAQLAQFLGNGTVNVDLIAAAQLNETRPGTWESDNVTEAEGQVDVTYTCEEVLETGLSCAASLGASGDTVTATVAGDESCTEVAITETISCDGNLTYTPGSDPANCTIIESPAGTLGLSCTAADVIPADGSKDYHLIGNITGTDGQCVTQVTAMSCETPTGQTLIADTSSCGGTYDKKVPPLEAIPTLSEWGLILLAGIMGLLGIQASRRRV